MPSRRRPWLLVPLLVVPLAGCLDDGGDDLAGAGGDGALAAAPDAASLPPPAPEPKPTATTGAIEGRVRTSALDPLPGARVTLQRSDASEAAALLQADLTGRFTVSGLAPARYVVEAVADGHELTRAEVTVGADEITPVRLILPPLPSTEPYSVPLRFTGLMSFGANVAGVQYTNGLQDPNHDVAFDFTVLPAHLETIMLRVTWNDPTAVLDFDLWYNVTCPPCEAEHSYAHASGTGDVAVRLDRPEDGWPGMMADNETLWLFAWPGTTDGQPASVAYQVRYDVQIETFYHAPAPEGHVLERDG